MCSGNDSGNSFMQKTLWCDTVYIGKKFPPLKFIANLMLVFGDGVLKPHHLWRGCREFRSGLASIMMIAPLNPADQENVKTAQVVELVLENQEDNWRFVHCTGVTCENCAQNFPCKSGIQQYGSSQKLMFGGVLSLLQSLKGGTNGFLESMLTM